MRVATNVSSTEEVYIENKVSIEESHERKMRILTAAILAILCMTTAYAKETLPDVLHWKPSGHEYAMPKDSTSRCHDIHPSGSETINDSILLARQEQDRHDRYWWTLFKKGKLAMRDTTVIWPRFLGFCVKVYNWADQVFSTTDTAYVVGTGKRWRARLINDNWNDSYYIKFSKDLNSIMSGDMHILAGPSLQYMAVSYAYMFDLSHMIGGGPINYRKQEFSFNCARFAAEGYYYENNGGTYIRTFGKYKKHKFFKLPFTGIKMTNFGIDAYYFFNGYKYSQAAAYGFAKIQKQSQGCWMGGLSYCNQDINVDFSELPEVLKPFAKDTEPVYRFHYHDYNILVGYGYNCVISPHWLFNVTVMPGIGFNHCYEDSQESSAKLFSLNAHGMLSFTYNSGNWFAGLQGKGRGYWYQSKKYSLFSTVQSIVLSGGYRF